MKSESFYILPLDGADPKQSVFHGERDIGFRYLIGWFLTLMYKDL